MSTVLVMRSRLSLYRISLSCDSTAAKAFQKVCSLQFQVLSAVETKNPGLVSREMKEKISDKKSFGVDTFYLRDDDVRVCCAPPQQRRPARAWTAAHPDLTRLGPPRSKKLNLRIAHLGPHPETSSSSGRDL